MTKQQYSIQDYANFLYSHKNGMNPIRLQKMMFYLYKLSLQRGEPIFNFNDQPQDGRFQAWTHGPVIPNVYREMKFKFNGVDEIDPEVQIKNKEILANLSKEILSDLQILNQMDTFKLRDLSHKNLAWIKAWDLNQENQTCSNILEDEEIKNSLELKTETNISFL